jgi:hypothetical protein
MQNQDFDVAAPYVNFEEIPAMNQLPNYFNSEGVNLAGHESKS